MGNTNTKTDYPGGPLANACSIRLLNILNSDREEDPIECSLAVVNLGTRPKFSALSYTWGPALYSFAEPMGDSSAENSICVILVNGQLFIVTENLFDALQQLRRSHMTDLLWIDAICIEQQNSRERAQQVSMMGRIYGAAEEVMKFIKPGLLFDTERMTDEDLAVLETRVIGAIRFISKRRWFSRAWVVQEIALSKGVRVLCGSSVLSWEQFTIFYTLLGITDWGRLLPQKVEGENQKQAYYAAHNAIEMFHDVRADLEAFGLLPDRPVSSVSGLRKERQGEGLGKVYGYETELEQAAAWLAHLLTFNRKQDCALKQDKVFSVLGITDCFQNPIGTLVRPNYSQSAQRVYEITVAQLILNNRFLSVLGPPEIYRYRSLRDFLLGLLIILKRVRRFLLFIRVQTIVLMLLMHAVRSDFHALSKVQNCL